MHGSSTRFLYAFTIFLGAFLLFAIQPIAGKHILPYFGGSSSVWATSLLFFTSALFLGYLYVYVLTKYARKTQLIVHGCITSVAALFVVRWFFSGACTAARGVEIADPSLGVLLVLAFSIGIPYFLLATTGPLLQYWFGVSQKREPYALYALSNVGSFAALISYPFLIEPIFPLDLQDNAWALIFFAYAVLVTLIAYSFFRTGEDAEVQSDEPRFIPYHRYLLWIGYASLPSFLLVATPTHITQVIAPVPLFFLGAAIFAYSKTPASYEDLALQVVAHLTLLFFCGLYCHVQLYRMRPEAKQSPVFYLFLSLGGAVGCLAATLLPPLLFPDYWEFTIGLALAGALAGDAPPIAHFPRIFDRRIVFATKIGLTLSIMILCFRFFGVESNIPEISSRN